MESHNNATSLCAITRWFTVSESVVTVSELTRRFGATTALASVSWSMPRGAVYGLVGANGAGKTTLIKHILGLLRAESEEHTSELQSRLHLVCRLLLEKKKNY